MEAEAWIGIGLTVLGLGMPAAAAILKLLPRKEDRNVTPCPIREHEARMGMIEKDVAVVQEHVSTVRAALVRIETKLDRLNDRHAKHED